MREPKTYVVGDIHGWWSTLQKLLDVLPWDSRVDHLWLVGDLVNRGPDSLRVLRWAKRMSEAMGPRFVSVLGNHDLHLLAADAGLRSPPKDLKPVLRADDRRQLVDWLRRRPFFHRAAPGGSDTVLVHAGLWPEWSPRVAAERGRVLSRALEDVETLNGLLSRRRTPGGGARMDALRRDLYGFTRLRAVKSRSSPQSTACPHKGTLDDMPNGCAPWFRAGSTPRIRRRPRVVFGHWAALGLHREGAVRCLDSGCAWSGTLTALRLEDERIFQVERP